MSGDPGANVGRNEVHFEGGPHFEPEARRDADYLTRPVRGLQGRPRGGDPHRMGRV